MSYRTQGKGRPKASRAEGGNLGLIDKARSVHAGDVGLGKTYWLWFWLPNIVFNIPFFVAIYSTMWFLRFDKTLFYYYLTITLVFILSAAWGVYSGTGVFRSANKAKSKFWAGAAKIAVVLFFLGLARNVFSLVGDNYSDADIQSGVIVSLGVV